MSDRVTIKFIGGPSDGERFQISRSALQNFESDLQITMHFHSAEDAGHNRTAIYGTREPVGSPDEVQRIALYFQGYAEGRG